METSETQDKDGEAVLKEEYSGEDSAANAAKNTALSIAAILDSFDQSIIDQSSKVLLNQNNIEQMYSKLMETNEKLDLVMQKLGMRGGGREEQGQPMSSIQPTQSMQQPPMSAEESLAMIAQNGSKNNNSGV